MAASVMLAKCNTPNQTYGIRVEQRGSDWVSTWAFRIDETKAKREGFHKTKITGTFQPAPEYPGCPYCGGHTLVQCGCGKMFCYNEAGTQPNIERKTEERKSEKKSEKKHETKLESTALKCPWCGVAIHEIKTVESFTVKSGGY
jgi:transcription elongation factor Elf1